MKTNEDYIRYFTNVVRAAKIELDSVQEYVSDAVNSGRNRFWGANNWTFKQRVATLSLDTSAESYDLPQDFQGMKTLREQNSNSGLRLKYFPREEFDRMVPKLSAFQTGYPQIYTIFGATSGQRKIRFYPQPTAQDLDMLYYCLAPTDTSAIPDSHQSGVKAAIAVDIYLPGMRGFESAYNEFIAEIKRLQIVDKSDMSDYTKYQDDTDRTITETLPWFA